MHKENKESEEPSVLVIHSSPFYCLILILQYFVWVDQKAEVCYLFHEVQFRCKDYFIAWPVLYVTFANNTTWYVLTYHPSRLQTIWSFRFYKINVTTLLCIKHVHMTHFCLVFNFPWQLLFSQHASHAKCTATAFEVTQWHHMYSSHKTIIDDYLYAIMQAMEACHNMIWIILICYSNSA